MIVLDASVWISSISPDDTNYPVSRLWRTGWRAGGTVLAVPAYSLCEVASAFTRRKGGSEARGLKALQEILDEPLIRRFGLDDDLAESAARCAARCRLRAGDAIYVALAQRLGVPLVTWDRELLEQAGELVTVRQPTA